MPRKSIVVVDVTLEFRISRKCKISARAVRGNPITTDV